jgi:hypothetical protein
VIYAAVSGKADKAQGTNGALRSLLRQPFGHPLIGIVSAGLFCFAAFSLIEARYRQV